MGSIEVSLGRAVQDRGVTQDQRHHVEDEVDHPRIDVRNVEDEVDHSRIDVRIWFYRDWLCEFVREIVECFVTSTCQLFCIRVVKVTGMKRGEIFYIEYFTFSISNEFVIEITHENYGIIMFDDIFVYFLVGVNHLHRRPTIACTVSRPMCVQNVKTPVVGSVR